jgi:hypothetical protein
MFWVAIIGFLFVTPSCYFSFSVGTLIFLVALFYFLRCDAARQPKMVTFPQLLFLFLVFSFLFFFSLF